MRWRTAISLLILFVLGLVLAPGAYSQQVENQRKIMSKEVPRYPDLARPMRLEGVVRLAVVVAPNGTVKSVRAMGGHPLLLKAAEDAVSKWRWIPTSQETTESVELKFRLD